MRTLLFLVAMLLIGPSLSSQQEKPVFLTFEFMRVNDEQASAYLETEDLWEKIHEQRIKNGDCVGWDLWRLSPGGEDQGYQYLTVTLFDDPVKWMQPGGFTEAWNAAYPDMSEKELDEKMAMTIKSRDIGARYYLYRVGFVGDEFEMPLGTLAVINFMKAKEGKYTDYEKAEMESFMPDHKRLIAEGRRGSWALMRNLWFGPPATEAYFSHITIDMYGGYEQFFKPASEDAPELSEEEVKALEEGLTTRDLISLYHATLIKKVR